MTIGEELKKFEEEQGTLTGYAMESVALFAVAISPDVTEKGKKV